MLLLNFAVGCLCFQTVFAIYVVEEQTEGYVGATHIVDSGLHVEVMSPYFPVMCAEIDATCQAYEYSPYSRVVPHKILTDLCQVSVTHQDSSMSWTVSAGPARTPEWLTNRTLWFMGNYEADSWNLGSGPSVYPQESVNGEFPTVETIPISNEDPFSDWSDEDWFAGASQLRKRRSNIYEIGKTNLGPYGIVTSSTTYEVEESHIRKKRFFFDLLFGIGGLATGAAALSQVTKLKNQVAEEFDDVAQALQGEDQAIYGLNGKLGVVARNQDKLAEALKSQTMSLVSLSTQYGVFSSKVTQWFSDLSETMQYQMQMQQNNQAFHRLMTVASMLEADKIPIAEELGAATRGVVPGRHVNWRKLGESLRVAVGRLHPGSSIMDPHLLTWHYAAHRFYNPFHYKIAFVSHLIAGKALPTKKLWSPPILRDNILHVTETCDLMRVGDRWCDRRFIGHFCQTGLSTHMVCPINEACPLSTCCESLLQGSRAGCTVNTIPTRNLTCYIEILPENKLYTSGYCDVKRSSSHSANKTSTIHGEGLIDAKGETIESEGLKITGNPYSIELATVTSPHLYPFIPPVEMPDMTYNLPEIDIGELKNPELEDAGVWDSDIVAGQNLSATAQAKLQHDNDILKSMNLGWKLPGINLGGLGLSIMVFVALGLIALVYLYIAWRECCSKNGYQRVAVSALV